MNKPYEKIDVVISTITKFYPKDINLGLNHLIEVVLVVNE